MTGLSPHEKKLMCCYYRRFGQVFNSPFGSTIAVLVITP